MDRNFSESVSEWPSPDIPDTTIMSDNGALGGHGPSGCRAACERRLVDVLIDEGGTHRHRRCPPQPHQHLVCTRCRRTIEIPVQDSPLTRWTPPATELGFTDVQITVTIVGVCPTCAARPHTFRPPSRRPAH